MDKNFLLGVGITNASEKEVLEYILYSLEKTSEKYYIVTPNPEILTYASKHPEFKLILNNARLALCDGTGVIWAGKILGKNFKEKVTGVDLMENLCKEISKKPITVGFLGGRDKIAERTAECLIQKYPGLQVVFVGGEWGGEGFTRAGKYQVSSIKYYGKKEKDTPLNTKYLIHNTKHIDVLFVAFGFPKQEEWIAKNLDQIPVRIAMTVGGSFDYLSGEVSRAPRWVRNTGLEWLYRLIRQPRRAKRQLALLEFILLVIKAKFSRS